MTPADDPLICCRTLFRLFVVGSTVNTTPLMVKLPAVTAVAKPALLLVFSTAPRLIPPMFDVLVAVYWLPLKVICAVSSLSTCARLPLSFALPIVSGCVEVTVTLPLLYASDAPTPAAASAGFAIVVIQLLRFWVFTSYCSATPSIVSVPFVPLVGPLLGVIDAPEFVRVAFGSNAPFAAGSLVRCVAVASDDFVITYVPGVAIEPATAEAATAEEFDEVGEVALKLFGSLTAWNVSWNFATTSCICISSD